MMMHGLTNPESMYMYVCIKEKRNAYRILVGNPK
jgi:hypothetical protein